MAQISRSTSYQAAMGPFFGPKTFSPRMNSGPQRSIIRRAPLVTVMGIELVLWPNKGESGSNK